MLMGLDFEEVRTKRYERLINRLVALAAVFTAFVVLGAFGAAREVAGHDPDWLSSVGKLLFAASSPPAAFCVVMARALRRDKDRVKDQRKFAPRDVEAQGRPLMLVLAVALAMTVIGTFATR